MQPSFSQQPPGFYSRRTSQVLNLPLVTPTLVDRELELSCATKYLNGDSRLVSLVGPAGVGKTHLAIHVASRLQDIFQRVAFVDLASRAQLVFNETKAPATTTHPQALTQALLGALGLTDDAQLVRELSVHKTLLVLDSFETVLAAAPSLSDLLARCPALSVLVTSRAPLGLRFEKSLELRPFTPSSAVAFFVSCAKAANPSYSLEVYQEATEKLCERLDGLPLALELAAACTAHLTPEALLDHLSSHAALPQLAAPDRPERHQNLGAMIDWSVRLFSDTEQTFFRRLGVMAGSFTTEAAEAVTGAKQLGLDALSTLLKLRNHGLLFSEASTPPRFTLLATAKAVALGSLTAPGSGDPSEFEVTSARHVQHYSSYAVQHAKLLHGAAIPSGLAVFSQEQDNLRAALRWSSGSNDAAIKEAGAGLAVATYLFWNIRGQAAEAHTWLETFRGTYPAPLHAAWLWALASAKLLLDENQAALSLAKESLRLAQSLKDETLVVKNFIVVVSAHRKLDHLEKALEAGKKTHKLAKDLGDPDLYVAILNSLALTHEHLGRPEEAKCLLNEALQVARSSGNLLWQALSMNNLALTAPYAERIALLQDSLVLLKQLGDEKRVAIIYVNLTDTHYRLGQFQEAQHFGEEGLAVATKARDRLHMGLNFNNLGLLARESGDLPRAEQHFAKALEMFRELGVRSDEAEVLSDWARCYRHDPERAAKQYLEALSIALESKHCVSITSCLDGLAELEVLAGRYREAVLLWGVAQTLWEHPTAPQFISERLFGEAKGHLDPQTLELVLQQGSSLSPQQLFYDLCKTWHVPYEREVSDVLSVRQEDVLKLVAQGYSSKKIAKVFELSEPTIKYHLKEIFDKLGVNSRAEAVAQAAQRGLL